MKFQSQDPDIDLDPARKALFLCALIRDPDPSNRLLRFRVSVHINRANFRQNQSNINLKNENTPQSSQKSHHLSFGWIKKGFGFWSNALSVGHLSLNDTETSP